MKPTNKCAFFTLFFLCVIAAQAQKATLTPDDVKAAINKGTAQTHTFHKEAGLGLVLSTELFRIQVFTPTTWVQWRAIHAAFAHVPYATSDDDLRPVLRVFVESNNPTTSGCGSVSKVLLRNKAKKDFVEPNAQDVTATATYQNLFGATMRCDAVYAEFNLSDVARIRSPDPEFTILLLKDMSGHETGFDIKKRHFEQIP